MTKNEFKEKWISSFARNVSKEDLYKSVLNKYSYLWHIFSWELVPCLKGSEARTAFDKIDKKDCLIIQMDFDDETIELDSDCKSINFDRRGEIFIVDLDFKWTYVVTHEIGICGPYFCKTDQ